MSIAGAIKKTINYADSFKSYINKDEIKKRLISKYIYPEKIIEREINKLKRKNKKNKWKEAKIEKARKLAILIENNFKDIVFLGISGSVASRHPKKEDDIDILVITKANALWKNRFFLRWWIYKNKIPHRSYNKAELEDQFCFNLWLDENYLEIPKDKQNLKSAVDLLLLIPLINKNHTYENFLLANNWAKKNVATPYVIKTKDLRFKIQDSRIRQNNFDKIINYLYFWPQYWYMKSKIIKEKVSPYQAFFHK